MHKYAITVGIEELPASQPVVLRGDFEESARIAKEAGYQGIELFLRNPKDVDGKRIREIADSFGLGFAGVTTGMEYTRNKLSLIDTNEEGRLAAVERLKEHVDLAAILDAPVIVGIMRSNIPDFSRYDYYLGLFTDSLLKVVEYAAEKNVLIVMESINFYINNYFNTVPETFDYIKKLNKPNLKIHIDTHSMNISDLNNVEAVKYCGNEIGFVHFSDSNRLRPGLGHINFVEMLDALDEVGYTDYISIECIPTPDPKTCAFEAMEYLKSIDVK